MIILGFDPGIATLGFGVIETNGHKHRLIDFGAITTPAGVPTPIRLRNIYTDVQTVIDRYRPDAVAVEELFFNNNVTTAINVAQARGVLLAACSLKTNELYEYTPLQVKQAVVGYGRAEKKQVQEMVRYFLGLTVIPKPDDAADALAIAICHAHTYKMSNSFKIQ
ncbi:MAG: crossover junction endodeoxyribonuclease RuvC [Clostridia bacterium]|nr:crossover junction endodeoxyribonuclease RuvC [Clostridia bacterium]